MLLLLLLAWSKPSNGAANPFRQAVLDGSKLLNHTFLYQYPLRDITSDTARSLNTLNLCNGVTIEEATIYELQNYLSKGRLTSEQLTACYIRRIFEVERFIK